jgi:hypothetical protein
MSGLLSNRAYRHRSGDGIYPDPVGTSPSSLVVARL